MSRRWPASRRRNRAEFSDSDANGAVYGEDSGSDHSEMMNGAADGFEPAQEEWMNRDLGSRAEIEQTLDTPLDNVFSEEPAEAAARNAAGCRADHLYRMGRRRLQR